VAKAPIEIRSLARSHTDKALKTLKDIMEDVQVQASARVAAAVALLDRGWGKPQQSVDMTVRRLIAKDLADDELADIAAGSSEGAAEAPIDPSQLN
jgi:formate dehydrogenase maturation protein FdhE